MTTPAYTEALERALGGVIARARADLDVIRQESAAVVAAAQARVAEAEAQVAGLGAQIRDRLAEVRDGEQGIPGAAGDPGPQGEPGPAGADGAPGEPGPQGERGFGLDDFDVEVADDGRAMVLRFVRGDQAEAYEIPLVAGPQGEPGERGADGVDGIDGQPGEPGPQGEAGPIGERGAEGPAGKLPLVKAWIDAVHYEGDVVTHEGATWQAQRDTGKAPGAEDWTCIAAPGANARELKFLGTFDPEAAYSTLNVVALNGASFVAKTDDPGPCPGDGWQLMASQGKRGQAGEKGIKGDRGERGLAGPAIVAAALDVDGIVTFTNADGSVVKADWYPVLSRIGGGQ